MSKLFNIKNGEVYIFKNDCYSLFEDSGGSFTINDKIVRQNKKKNFVNPEIPIKLSTGKHDAIQLYKKKIFDGLFKSIILGPMTKTHLYFGPKFDTKKLVLVNHSYDEILVMDCADLKKYDLVDKVYSIEVIDEIQKFLPIKSENIPEDIIESALNPEDILKKLGYSDLEIYNNDFNTNKDDINQNDEPNIGQLDISQDNIIRENFSANSDKDCIKMEHFLIMIALIILIFYLIKQI